MRTLTISFGLMGFLLLSPLVGYSKEQDNNKKNIGIYVNHGKLSVENPHTFLTKNFETLKSNINKSHASYEKNPDKLYKLIKEIVLPHIAVNQMAGNALGDKWRKATPNQRKEFIDQFSKLLTRTYAIALLKVSDYGVTIRPLRGSSWRTQQVVSLQAKITNKSNNQSSSATFYLKRSGSSWKIFDLAVEGVSIEKNFQAQFQSFNNLKEIITKLKKLNQAVRS